MIRQLQAHDRAAWAPLWFGYQAFYHVELRAEVTEVTWQRILNHRDPVHGLGAFVDAHLVGITHYLFHRTTWQTSDTCYLQDLFVAPQARGGGIARQLIEGVYAAADAKGAGQVYWLTHETNSTARKLYDTVATNAGFIAYERFVEA